MSSCTQPRATTLASTRQDYKSPNSQAEQRNVLRTPCLPTSQPILTQISSLSKIPGNCIWCHLPGIPAYPHLSLLYYGGGTHSPPWPSYVTSGRLSGSLSLAPHLQNGGTVLPFKGHQSRTSQTLSKWWSLTPLLQGSIESLPSHRRDPGKLQTSASNLQNPEVPLTTTRGFCCCQHVWLWPWLLRQQPSRPLRPTALSSASPGQQVPGRRAPEGGGARSARLIIWGSRSVSPLSNGGEKPLSVSWWEGERKSPRWRSEHVPGARRGSGSTDTAHQSLVPKQIKEASAELSSPPHLLSNGKTSAEPNDINPSQTTTGIFSFPFNLTDMTANSTWEANREERLRTVMDRRCGVDLPCQMRKRITKLTSGLLPALNKKKVGGRTFLKYKLLHKGTIVKF